MPDTCVNRDILYPDPGSGAFFTPGSGMGKQKSRSGSGINILDHISEISETIFWVKMLKFYDADADPDPGFGNLFDPGSGMEKNRIRNIHPGSGTLPITVVLGILNIAPPLPFLTVCVL